MLNCKVYSYCYSVAHIALLCAIFSKTKKSWKIFVVLFGGMKYSSFLCRRFSGARQFESKLSLRSLAKSFDKIGCASAIREQVLMALDLHYLCTHN